ncbi:MAG: hypothetical protein LLG42_00340 [Chloroflexi bacterium]|nr:hypothetical protein [Chloroflexota bacterium]
MSKKVVTVFLMICVFLSLNNSPVTGQSYSFQLPSAQVNYLIESDGTATIEYIYVFSNDNGAPDIEFVDIGMPAGSTYSYSDMSATIDEQAITHIQNSEYVSNGVEFGLGSNAIPAGQTGTFHAVIRNVSGTVFPGTAEEQETYVGTQFQPNYFDGSAVSGKTDMTVTIILPPGLTENEPRYYTPDGWPGADEPETGFMGDRAYYRWQSADARGDGQYLFGASFPARLIPESAIAQPPANNTFSDNSSGGISVAIGNFIDNISGFACCGIFALFFGWTTYQGVVGSKKRRMQYLPPKVSIEGHGIKRGLTAVEAAVLMQQPIDKVFTMILFSVVKKNAAEVVTRDPLEIKLIQPTPEDLRGYETDFLKAFETADAAKRRLALQDLMVKLIQSVTQKMKGFSHKETVEYYKQIIEKAWEHVTAEDTPEVKVQNLEEAMDWTMADKDYENRSRRTFTGPVFLPMWWGRYDPTFSTSSTGGGTGNVSVPRPSGSGQSSLPQMPGSDFAASVVNGVSTFSAGVIGNLTNFTGAVTNKTNPIPKSSGRSSGRSGGGCACACACASCACACAGGGR